MKFSLDCRDCPRLARFLHEVRRAHPDYHARPVAPFGAAAPHLLIVGLAPGMHGANRSGRPFTGDFAGILLYDSYHCSRYNTQTRRLTEAMFNQVFTDIVQYLSKIRPKPLP